MKKNNQHGNLFINQYPYKIFEPNSFTRFINKAMIYAGFKYKLQRLPDPYIEMNTIEQRMNFFHLLKSVLDFNVPGEIIELGSYTGQCAIVFQKVISESDPARVLKLYDSFEGKFSVKENIEGELASNFKKANLKMPVVVKGRFEETIPEKLPVEIAFTHIDCGVYSMKAEEHKKLILFLLKNIYPLLSKGAGVCMMDYHDKESGHDVVNYHPGVKMACDEFFADKEETVLPLYGNECPSGYFRKL